MRRAWLATPAVGALLLAGAGCSSSTASTGAQPAGTLAPTQSGTVEISARDNSFVAETVTVTAGSKLVWHNDGRNDHNIIPVGNTPFHADTADFEPKADYEFTTKTTGTFKYYCSIHGTSDKGMIGTVQVVAP